MTAKETILAALTGVSLLAAPVQAGGPVIVEDATETAAPRNNAVPFLIAGALILALIAGQSHGCNGPEETPEPAPGGC
jgi:hypothetical protein